MGQLRLKASSLRLSDLGFLPLEGSFFIVRRNFSGISRALVKGSKGFQPVVSVSLYRQDADATSE